MGGGGIFTVSSLLGAAVGGPGGDFTAPCPVGTTGRGAGGTFAAPSVGGAGGTIAPPSPVGAAVEGAGEATKGGVARVPPTPNPWRFLDDSIAFAVLRNISKSKMADILGIILAFNCYAEYLFSQKRVSG